MVGVGCIAPAQVINNWTNPASARWDSSPSWSLATIPASSQSVNITNEGYKAVNIDSAIIAGFPDSLTVSDLFVAAPTNGLSTLLLNYAGLAAPLKVLNGCTISTNGMLDNFSSSFEVDGGADGQLLIDGGLFTQQDGLTVVNAAVFVQSGSINATNGALTLGEVSLGSGGSTGTFNQDGGSIAAQRVNVQNGTYTLASGTLYAIGGTDISTGAAHFNHAGGTNYGDITITAGSYTLTSGMAQGNVLTTLSSLTTFQQNGGLLDMQEIDWSSQQGGFQSGSARVGSFNLGPGSAGISGTDMFVTNSVTLAGSAAYPFADFTVSGGSLHAQNIVMHDYSVFRMYYSGSNELSGGLTMEGSNYITFLMWGGTLETPYIGVGLNTRFSHNAGQNFVHGVLSISGNYDFAGGMLMTDGLYLRGALSLETPLIDTNLLGTIINNDVIDLGGTLSTRLPDASLGQVQLSTNANIVFTGSPAQLHFASSVSVAWNPGQLLLINNWTNSSNLHIFFGTDSSGLTASQLAQIQFVNPGGFAAGTYSAQLLSTGELVPVPGSTTSGTLNAWLNPGSGDWQDQTAWSLGILPARDQTIMITNQGWKAIAIGPATSQNFPQSLNVASVILGGYTDSFNVLLLNYAGLEVPLTAGTISIGTNSGITALGSAINISTNRGTGALTNESAINQGDSAMVTATSLQIGTMQAAGVYNLTNGSLAAQQAVLGEVVPVPPFGGAPSPFNPSTFFNQFGGSVALNLLRLDGGTYRLSDGVLGAGAIQVRRGSFQQTGGSVTGAVGVALGSYLLSGGILRQQSLELPTFGLFTGSTLNGTFLQTGATNYCDAISVWNDPGSSATPDYGSGHFVLSNGVLYVSNLTYSHDGGDFQQWGGLHTNAGTVLAGESVAPYHDKNLAKHILGGGTLLTPSIDINYGTFTQSGGTNLVATHVAIGELLASYILSSGVLCDSNTTVVTSGYGYGDLSAFFTQSGGIHVVTNLLSVSADSVVYAGPASYTLSGGQLTVGALQLSGGGGTFVHAGGTLTVGGLFTLGGIWDERTTGQQFGQLLLSGVGGTNSVLQLPAGPCQLRFGDSSSLAWSSNARLLIRGWNGSPTGGGQHQVVFGNNSAALTPQQLGLIQFQNPAGTTGTFPAMILATGEVVPGPSLRLQVQRTASGLTLSWAGGTLQSATNIAGPFQDVPSATSPYPVLMTEPQEFFRIRP